MRKKKLNKQQLREKKKIEDKRFMKSLLVRFGILFLLLGLILVFVTYWCDTRYTFRKYALYGKELSFKLICMHHNKLTYHESVEFEYDGGTFYVCSDHCQKAITNNYSEEAFIADTYSEDTVRKCDAIIGLKERGEPNVLYFTNKQNFEKYYKVKEKK